MRFAALLSAIFILLISTTARADFLNTQGALAPAWAALLTRIPDNADILEIGIAPDEIVVNLQSAAGKGGPVQITLTSVPPPQGPEYQIDGPVPTSETFGQSFRLADVHLDQFDAMLATALTALKLGPEAEVSRVLVGHLSDDADVSARLVVVVQVDAPPYLGSVELTPAGQMISLSLFEGGLEPAGFTTAPPTPATPAPTPATPAPTPAAPFRGDSGSDLVAALARFAETLGPETRIYEIDARPDRVTIDRPHPTQPGTVTILTLTAQGFRDERTFPTMMQTEADLFPLSALTTLTPEAIEAARASGLAAVGLPGGQLERLRLWSGAPFWRHPAGEPFFDIRVGVAPNGQPNGYAVVTLGGQVVESFR